MQSSDIGARERGKIWHRRPSPLVADGVIVNVTHSVVGYHSKTIRFLHVAFDAAGEAFLAGDHQGNIYLFDLSRNSFKLVQRTGQACTALAFNLRRKTEYLVALADYSVKCFDTDTKELVSWMRGHESAVSSISVHGSGRYAITTSSDAAQLWDLDTFQRKRKLNVHLSVGIQKVYFLPLSNTIISCFRDDSIFAWESDTLHCKYQLPVPEDESRITYRAFAVTRDGQSLVAGGKSNFLHLWCLNARQLQRIIQMPPKVRTVRHLEFLPNSFDGGSSQVIGVLSQDGIMRFINVQTCKLLFDIGSLDNGINTVAISQNGHYIAAVLEDGSLNIYSVKALSQELNKNVLPAGLNKKRLQALLKEFGEYPEKYRMFIWRSLLQLPENHAAFSSLTDKGTHAAYLGIHERYPIKSRKLLRVLQRVLSAMAHWSAIFAEVSYLPLLAFPFVKLFQNNQLIGFEVVATIIISWCQHWFEYFPNPPINILSVVENILAHHDKELLQHLVKYNITSQLYAWPLMETLFSEVLTREEWLKLFDNVFSNHPSFLLVAVAAYLICSRTPLLQCNIKGDLEHFFHHRNNLDLSAVIKEAYHLMDTTPEDINPKRMLDDFVPLTKGQYPIFNKYPKFVVNYQTKEREKIWHEELDYLKERQLAHGLQAESVKRQAENAAWYRQQQLLQEAEEQRRKILLEEEQKLVEQRVRLAAMKRELKVKELQVLDAAHKRFLKHQQEQQKSELRRLDDEIDRKVALRSKETAALIQDIEVRNMELDMQKKIFEQQLAKDQETVMRGVKGHLDTNWIKADVEEQKFKRVLEMDQDPNVEDYKNNEEELATADQLSAAVGWQAQMLHKQRVYNLDQKKCQTQLAHLASESRERETKLLQMTKEVEGKRWDEVVGRHVQPKASQQERAAAEAQRPPLLLDEMSRAAEHDGDLHKNLFEGLCHTSTKYPTKQRRDPLQGSGEENPGSLCLNNVSLDSSVQLSLDRGRADLESKERELMTGIQELRQKLTTRARQRYSTSSLADEMIYTHY
ncbi:TBC1 domain family member 31 isoform X2 [Carcharodon carcharias]|uniref:TBC1 domain family member 31 isoform X2 n=1 Tax=Carcharodon carcharias TaxID=13397 RepID=UPI001B7F705C|nr:TBC1 domain family member 31 isoform X2 [Carcharodon carcharias]